MAAEWRGFKQREGLSSRGNSLGKDLDVKRHGLLEEPEKVGLGSRGWACPNIRYRRARV